MKKQLITLIILSFFTIGSILIFNKTTYALRQPTGISGSLVSQEQQTVQNLLFQKKEVTIGEWNQCIDSIEVQNPCTKEKDFQKTAYKFAFFVNLTCSQMYDIFLNGKSNPDLPLNQNNWYEDCFFSPIIQQVANSNICFKTYGYDNMYVKCAGF